MVKKHITDSDISNRCQKLPMCFFYLIYEMIIIILL